MAAKTWKRCLRRVHVHVEGQARGQGQGVMACIRPRWERATDKSCVCEQQGGREGKTERGWKDRPNYHPSLSAQLLHVTGFVRVYAFPGQHQLFAARTKKHMRMN
jgi:hypothetical protein